MRTNTGVSPRVWLEAVGAAVTGTLLLLTMVWREWIEVVFRVDLDHGSGSLEWAFVVATGVTTVVLASLAGCEWHRAR
ncbi:MAG: transporter permease, partial [Acidimicrobiia bacterium]|nr:transporter permease [Acidimicrobiia bacterium]